MVTLTLVLLTCGATLTLGLAYTIYQAYENAKQLKLKKDREQEQQAMIEFGERAARIQQELQTNPDKYNFKGCQSCKNGNCTI